MKYVKILGLLAVAAAALMAFAATASATTITSPTGTAYTGEIHATSEGHATLSTFVNIECHSTTKGLAITAHGSGVTADGNISSLLWGTSGNLNGNCTNNWHVETLENGSLEIHWKAEHEGTLTSTGSKVAATRFGITCTYKTNATDIGTLTDSHATGSTENGMTKTETPNTATLDVNALIPIVAAESGFLCGTGEAHWTGSYKVETPDKLYIDQN